MLVTAVPYEIVSYFSSSRVRPIDFFGFRCVVSFRIYRARTGIRRLGLGWPSTTPLVDQRRSMIVGNYARHYVASLRTCLWVKAGCIF